MWRRSSLRRSPAAPGRPRSATGTTARSPPSAAVVEIGKLRLTGLIAWVFWCVAHVYFLIGFRNRLQVTLDWIWAYLTFERGSRLITGDDQAAAACTAHLSGACTCPTL
jgi:NADH dehydrogenase